MRRLGFAALVADCIRRRVQQQHLEQLHLLLHLEWDFGLLELPHPGRLHGLLWRDPDDGAGLHHQPGHVHHGGPERVSVAISSSALRVRAVPNAKVRLRTRRPGLRLAALKSRPRA